MPCLLGARSKRCNTVSPGVSARRRVAPYPGSGGVGNQAVLRRSGLLQRQTTDTDPKPTPPPLLPLGKDWFFDPSASHPGAPKPWDKPGGDPGGAGGSLEDLNKGYHTLFDKKAPPALNTDFKMPPCSVLEAADSTSAVKKYLKFQTYDTMRKLYHSPLTKDPWPQLTAEQYQAACEACKSQAAPKPAAPTPPPPKQAAPPAAAAPAKA